MKVFITGGSGLLGSKVAEIALERGYDVYSGYSVNKPEFGKSVKFDLAYPDSVVKVISDIRPDVIIHSAALTDVDRCEVERELAYKINVEGTKIVAEMARKFGSFLVYISTDYVFDGSIGMYREDDETNPPTTTATQNFWERSIARIFALRGPALFTELNQRVVRLTLPYGLSTSLRTGKVSR